MSNVFLGIYSRLGKHWSPFGFFTQYGNSAWTFTKDSGRININQGLESIVISSSLVDDQSGFDSSGEHSQVIAVLPIDTTQRLNGTMTNYGELEFSAPIFNGNVRQFTITVGDNLLRTSVKLHLFAECQIKNGK